MYNYYSVQQCMWDDSARIGNIYRMACVFSVFLIIQGKTTVKSFRRDVPRLCNGHDNCVCARPADVAEFFPMPESKCFKTVEVRCSS